MSVISAVIQRLRTAARTAVSVATYREFLRTPSVSWLILTSIVGRFTRA